MKTLILSCEELKRTLFECVENKRIGSLGGLDGIPVVISPVLLHTDIQWMLADPDTGEVFLVSRREGE